MKGMPFNFQAKGVLEVAEISSISSDVKWKDEPTSILDTRRSPSPPTSTSTLSSSFGGGGGSTDTAGVAAVSDNPPQKWPPTQQQEDSSAAVVEPGGAGAGVAGGGVRKDEWASELQPIPSGIEIVSGGGGVSGVEKCGLGMEEWETMYSETTASPSQEQLLLPWIMLDNDDPSSGLKQLLQSGGSSEFENHAGYGIIDQGFGFEPTSGNVMTTINPSLTVPPASGFVLNNTNNNSNGRISCSIPNPSVNYKVPYNPPNPIFSSASNNPPMSISLPPPLFYQEQPQQFESSEEKPQFFSTQAFINQHQVHHPQNPAFFAPLALTGQQEQHLLLPPQPKRHHPATSGGDATCQITKVRFGDQGQELFLRRQQQPQQGFPHQLQFLPHQLQQRPTMVAKPGVGITGDEMAQQQQQQQQVLVDQLLKAAQLIETGNSVHARGILARLNHQLSHVGKPLQRVAFYFKEALQLLLTNSNNNNNTGTSPSPRNPTSFDIIYKIGAYKAFSEISPLAQFSNFTCNQALLEELDGFNRIHIIDFDIGLGLQWSSFIQELRMRMGGAPSLKITAMASSSSPHPFELLLMRESLSHFANDNGIVFEINILNLESYEPASWPLALNVSETEAIAVNLPAGVSSIHPSLAPSLLRFVRQLSPKIVVSIDRGCHRNDLPFSHHLLHALNSYTILLDSLDSLNVDTDIMNKIERFLFQPTIESIVVGRHRVPDKIPPWRNLFVSAGFSPLTFSNLTEIQAECLVKKTQVRGFHVEKRQAALVLFWQRQELVSASAWRC